VLLQCGNNAISLVRWMYRTCNAQNCGGSIPSHTSHDCIFMPLPLLRFLTLTFLEHLHPESMPGDHRACNDCTEQDDTKVPDGKKMPRCQWACAGCTWSHGAPAGGIGLRLIVVAAAVLEGTDGSVLYLCRLCCCTW